MKKAKGKKITVNAICGNIPVPTKATPIMRVWGIAYGTRLAKTIFGNSLGFTGTFAACNIATGEEFTAPEFFAPPVLGAIVSAMVRDANGGGAQFAYDISVAPNPDAPEKFGYVSVSLLPASVGTALDSLREALPALPSIEGTKEEPKADPAPAAKKEEPTSKKKEK